MLWIDYAYSLDRAVRALVELGDEPAPTVGRIGDDAVFRDQVASVAIDAQALLLHGLPRLLEVHGRASPRRSTRC